MVLFSFLQNELQNLQDAEDEIMIALDGDEKVPYMVGEVFIMKSQVSELFWRHVTVFVLYIWGYVYLKVFSDQLPQNWAAKSWVKIFNEHFWEIGSLDAHAINICAKLIF